MEPEPKQELRSPYPLKFLAVLVGAVGGFLCVQGSPVLTVIGIPIALLGFIMLIEVGLRTHRIVDAAMSPLIAQRRAAKAAAKAARHRTEPPRQPWEY